MKLGKFLEPGYYLTADRYVITQLPHGMFKVNSKEGICQEHQMREKAPFHTP